MGTVSVLIITLKNSFFLHSSFERSGIWHDLSVKEYFWLTLGTSLMMLAGPGRTKAAFRSESLLRDVHRYEKFTLQYMV